MVIVRKDSRGEGQRPEMEGDGRKDGEKNRHVCEFFPVVMRRKGSCLLLSLTLRLHCVFMYVVINAINSSHCLHFIRTLFCCSFSKE